MHNKKAMSAKKKPHSKKHNSTSEDGQSASSARTGCVQSNNTHMDELFQSSVEKCDFCDQFFNNKYSILVHNAEHIIIPLLKKTYHQCPECLHHFETIEHLDAHTIDKHPHLERKPVPDLLESLVTKEPAIIVKNPIEINEVISTKESLLQSLVKRQPLMVLTKEEFGDIKEESVYEINNDDTIKSDMGISDLETKSITVKSDIDDSNLQVKYDLDYEDAIGKFECDNEYGDVEGYCKSTDLDINKPRIKDRLMFEDDDDSDTDELLSDLTTSVTVDLEMFDDNWINGINRLQNESPENNGISNLDVCKKNSIILGNKPNVEAPVEIVWESVHFDELTQPGVFKCSRCDEEFGDRYTCIVHETSHLRLKRRKRPFLCRYCDWYISNVPLGLYKHMLSKHPDYQPRRATFTRCKDCGLNYVRLRRHLRNYHNKYLCLYQGCGEIYMSHEALEEHKCSAHGKPPRPVVEIKCSEPVKPQQPVLEHPNWMLRTVSVCDLCYSFFKNKVNLQYDFLGEKNEIGKRIVCERCQKFFFSLNIVQLKYKKQGKHLSEQADRPHPPKKNPCSNSERLKNMQQRLKKMKLLNKF